MADFTITVSNSMRVFGPAPTFWGTGIWGTSKWGDGSESLPLGLAKFFNNAMSIGTSVTPQAVIELLILETLSFSSVLTDQEIQDSAGYNRVFVKPATNAENRNVSSFTSVPNASTVWSAPSDPSTTWGES